MANNAFQDLVNKLILENNERMNATIDQAHTQTGVETSGLITQGSTSDLLEDIKWIKGRGYASGNKKAKMSNEVKQHYTQAIGLYSKSIEEKIRFVRENTQDEEERNKQIDLVEKERIKFEEELKNTLERAEAEIEALPVVKNNLDTLPATRASYRASVAQRAAKINNKIAQKLKAIQESEFNSQEELEAWAKKQRDEMDEMYDGALRSPAKTVEELLKSNPPKPPKPMTKIPSQPKKTVESTSADKAIRDAFQKNYGVKQGVDRKEWMKSNFAYDTETTKIQNEKASAATLAFARYVEKENGQMVAEAKSFFLQYNSKSKKFEDNLATVNVIREAINATTDKDKNKLLESAVQMRKKLGLQQNGEVSEDELQKVWDSKIKDSLVTPEELFKVVEEWKINGSNLWGFNNAGFDSKVLKNWIKQYDGESGKAGEELNKIFEASTKNDLMIMAKEAAKLQEGMGGLRKGSSFLMGKSKVANSLISGVINLQGFVSTLTGSSSSGAHEDSDDAINTLRLADQVNTTNFFQQFFGALEQGIRNRLGGKKIQRNEKGQFSEDYKDVVYDSAYALRDIFNPNPQLEGIGEVDTRVPNQQITQKFARLGKDVRNLATSEFSVDRLKEKIVAEYAARGVGVKFDGNKVGFYSLEKYKDPQQVSWDEMATVEMAELDDSGSLRRGRQSVANLTYLDYLFRGKGRHPKAAIYSGLEAQYQHLLNVAGYQKDENGNFVDSAIVSAIKNGDLDRASNIAGIGVSSVLKGSPTGTASSVLNEIDGMMSGYKNPEQLILNSGLFSTIHLAERVLRFHADQVQEIYNNNPNSRGKITQFNPNEISDNEYRAVTRAYAMIAGGFTDEEYFTGADPLTKALVTNKQLFGDFQKMVETFVTQGLVPDLASLKEEAFGSGLLTTSGARDVLPFNIYDDQGSRASHQVFKYAERVNEPTMSRPMLFSSQVGMNNDVDYGKRELSQYLGAATSDAKLAEALQLLDSNIKDTFVSVREGGVIMSKSMAKELSGYRRQQYEAYDDEINAAFIRDVLKIDPKSLANLKEVNGPLEFNKTLEKDVVFANNQKLAKGDVILGLERVGESLKLLVKRFEQVETGTKMLTEGGGRYTARVVDDKYYNDLTEKLGVKGAQFLYEEKGYDIRHMMPKIRGRLSYMIGEAVNQGMKQEDLLKIMKDNLQLAKGMQLDKNGRFYDTVFLDNKTNRYKYKDEHGKTQDLFDNKVGAELEEAVRKAFVEVSENSDFSKFGMALQDKLGIDKFNYAATSHLTSQFINMTDEIPYYDAMGSGDIDSIDKQGRVKVADRERRAFERVISSIQNSMNRGVIGSAIEEGLSLYRDDQLRQFTQQGKVGEKARGIISQIDEAIYARQHGGYSTNQNGEALVLVARDAVEGKNELDIRSLSTSFKFDKGQTGLTPEQYHNTIMAVAREKAQDLGLNNIAIEYGGQTYLLADQAPTEIRGKYLPSATDRANNKLFKALLGSNDIDYQEKMLNEVLGTDRRSKGSDYYKMAYDKDSQIFKDANEVKVGNASYSKAVGRNIAYTSKNPNDINTVYIHSEKLKDLMRSAENASVNELKKNIQNLRYMAKASGSKSFDKELDLSGVRKAKNLRNIENSIIAKIVGEVESGQYSLLGQAHRYPSTSGLDIRHTKIGVDNQLSRDAISLSAGLSATINADYDGDKIWQRLSFLNSDYNSFEEFQKAYSAASDLTEMDRKIAAHMENWVKADEDKLLRQENEKEADYIARQNKAIDEEIDGYVKAMSSPDQGKLASIFNKSNKEYVGKFSNISTNVRTFMQDAKMDESGAGGRQSGLSVILRAYLESLEQDAISAKKVFKRLSGKNGERGKAALDELQSLYNYIGKGEFTKAVEYSQGLNLGFEKSRQLEFAKAYLMTYSPDLYEKEFKGVFEETDKDKRAAAIANLVKEGWDNLVNVATLGGGGNIEDALYLTEDRKGVVTKAAINLSKHRALSPREREAAQKAQEKLTEEQRQRNQEAITKAKEARDSATFTSGNFVNQDGINYDKYHMRTGWIPNPGGEEGVLVFKDELVGDDVTRNVLSVTGLFGKEQTYQSFADKQRAEIAAAKGTYAHRVSELLGKTGFTSVDELFGTEYEKELLDALNTLKRTEGLEVTEDLEQQLNLRAALASKTAKKLGFFDQGNGVQTFQEAILGGKFSNADNALAGQADLLRISEKEGITVGDYKFSADNSPATVAKRIAQASAYLYLEEETLKSELSGLKKKQDAGTASDADIARITSIENTLQAAANGGRKVQVIRNYTDKTGRIFTEVIESEALSAQAIAEMLNDAQISAELKAKIQQLQALINKGSANDEQVKEYHRLLAQLASTNAFSPADVTSRVGNSFTITTTDEYGQVVKQQSPEEQKRQTEKDIKSYLNNYKQQQKVREQIQLTQQGMRGKSGEDLLNQQAYLRALQEQLVVLQQQAPVVQSMVTEDGRRLYTINGLAISEQQLLELKKQQAILDSQHVSKQAKITALSKEQVGFLSKLIGGLKQRMIGFIDTSLAYQAIGKIRQAINMLIQTAVQLDAAMVNIQIATGNTGTETRALMLTYVDLANEMGRTTQSVAQASNDWLRAGYEGKEAAELTKASMMLSTLGMIEATQATTYLISTLKGWKLSASEVIGVVDKLTAVDMAAAVSAGDLALAMSRANNSARLAGSDMNQFIGYVTTVADVTQKSAESVGESFKTIYSRFGNVKANKFAASYEDQNSEGYNSAEFENLNDIETVLDRVGIKLRENASTWRDIDTVLEDIAKNWKTWDRTTQNAVATAVAGTRQRENVITLFENWDDVAKYAEIAENAYGTATEKMEAYTDSIEASKQRMTTAVEEWALKLHKTGVIKDFYDQLTYIIKNLRTFGLVLAGLATFTNLGKVTGFLGSSFGKIGAKLSTISGITSSFTKGGLKEGWQSAKQAAMAPLETARLNRQMKAYGATLNKYANTLSDQELLAAKNMQTDLLALRRKDRMLISSAILETQDENKILQNVQGMSADARQTLASNLLANCKNQERRRHLERLATMDQVEMSEKQLAAAQEALAEELRIRSKKPGYMRQIGQDVGDSAKDRSALIGAGYMGGSILGGVAASSALKDANSTVQILGATGASMLGGYAGKSGMALLTGAKAATAGGIVGLIVAVATLAFTGIYGIIKNQEKKRIEEAQEEFKAAEEKFSQTKSMSATAAKFDELSKGVDSFGKNVSLSEEEYQSFLDVSNQLCDTFPELLGYMDEEGNKIAKIGSNAISAADAIQKMTDNAQRSADIAMTNKDVMGPALKEAQKELKEAYSKVTAHTLGFQGLTLNQQKSWVQKTESEIEQYQDEEGLIDRDYLEKIGGVWLTDGASDVLEEAYIYGVVEGGYLTAEQYAIIKERAEVDEALNVVGAMQAAGIADTSSALAYMEAQKVDEAVQTRILGIVKQLETSWGDTMWKSFSGSNNMVYTRLNSGSEIWQALGSKNFEYDYGTNAIDDFQAQVSVLEAQVESINKSMADYAMAYGRQNKLLKDVSDEEFTVYSQAITRVNIAKIDEFGNVIELSLGEYKAAIDNIIQKINKVIGTNDTFTQLITNVANAENVGSYHTAQNALLTYFIRSFADSGFDPDELAVMEAYGFKYSGSGEEIEDFVDTTDKKQQLAEKLGWDVNSKLFQAVWRNWGLNEMSLEDFQKVFNLAASGEIGASTSLSILRNLMRSDVSGGKTKEEAELYYEDLSAQQGSIIDRVKNFYAMFKDGATPENVSSYFSDLPENLRTAILEGSEAGGLKNWEEVANGIKTAYDAALSSSKLNLAKTYSQYAFAGIEDKNGDEILGEWSEIQEMIEATAESYDLLRTAQEEYAESNRITWQTALKLMETNPEYMKFLDATDKGVTFKKLEEDMTTEQVAMMMQVSTIEKNAVTKEESLTSRNKTLRELMANMNESDPLYATYSEELSRNEAQLLALEQLKSAIAEIVESGFSQEVFEKHFGSEALTAVEKLTTALESLNKEYEQMMGYGSTGNPASWMEEEYYKVKRNNLDTLITNANDKLTEKFGDGYTLAQILDISSQADREKYLGYYNDIQKYTVERKNLDDEQAQDAINILKGKKADLSQVAEAYWDKILTSDTEEEFYENYQQYLDAYMADFDKKIADIQYKIDILEKSKPQEWRTTIDEDGKILTKAEDRIATYYTKMGKYYKDQYNEAAKALENVAFLTEDEIKKLVNQANDSLKKMKENDIAKAEAIKDYQEKVYSALRNEVNRYIDDLNDQKKVIEEIYDTELEKLKDKEDAISRTNKLIELQNNLLNAQKEKERVYRAGIGWTYESNRNKVREAEKQIDDFYRQDNIDDLNNAKDAELKNLEDRVQNWQKYLDMLEEQYKEYEVAEEKRLLKELLEVETDEEIKNIIVKDLNNFVTQIGEKYDLFTKDQDAFYSNYHSAFSTFLDNYAKNLGVLAELKGTELELMSLPEEGGLGLDLVNWEQVDYSDKADKADTLEMVDTYLRLRTLKAMNKGIDISGEGAYRSNEQIRNEWIAKHSGEYSNGILGGPVSYTGLAMLHGSPSKPEYVLNNDQAYNLLRYMSTTRMPAFNSTKCGDSGTQYIVQGDIILEGVNNPQEFWGEVTKAMGNRWNVTKNR